MVRVRDVKRMEWLVWNVEVIVWIDHFRFFLIDSFWFVCFVFIWIKGDGSIQLGEFNESDANLYSPFIDLKTEVPQKSISMLPKRGCDLINCEIIKLFKLTNDSVIPVSFQGSHSRITKHFAKFSKKKLHFSQPNQFRERINSNFKKIFSRQLDLTNRR